MGMTEKQLQEALEEAHRRIDAMEAQARPIVSKLFARARPYWREWAIALLAVMMAASAALSYMKVQQVRELEAKLTLQEDIDKATEKLKGLEEKAKAQEEANRKLLEANARAKEDSQRIWFQIQKRRAELDSIKPQQIAADVQKLPIAEKSKELEAAGIPNTVLKVTQ